MFVPQGSILDPLLFYMLLRDFVLFICNIEFANYVNGNTPHSTSKDLEIVLKDLEEESNVLLKRFTDNFPIVNTDKNLLLIISNQERYRVVFRT